MIAILKRLLLLFLMIGSAVCLPLSCYSTLFVVGIFMPFKTCVDVTNELDEPITFTLLGRWAGHPDPAPLTLLLDVPGYVPYFGYPTYGLDPGQTCGACYDDDVFC